MTLHGNGQSGRGLKGQVGKKLAHQLIQEKNFHRNMSSPNELSRPNLKRTRNYQRQRTRTTTKPPGLTEMRDRVLNPPAQRPERTRSASPPSRKRKLCESQPQRQVRQRRNSAGPLFSSTPYSLSVDYVDRRTGKNQDHFVETLTRHSHYSPKYETSRCVYFLYPPSSLF